ncbi:transcription cofactor vestigial-like protein 2 [Thalassophryne amazonica]|uniref:transcription cofactor vestigial-like protein 2 n=1 Tax=Thalassophryne amazonica TaxID=390379 RepID=UPI0014718FF9|nr:transcription cofactor vestigial-like protein 2 [Thalassophryne amazonica]
MQKPHISSSQLGSSGPLVIKEEDKEPILGAEYLSSRCVLFTYFQGDINAVVDEHFSRALSNVTVFPDSTNHKAIRDGSFPMNQRSLPSSFWNSSYQSAAASSNLSALHTEPSFHGDPYSSVSLYSHLQQPCPETWHSSHHRHYSLGAVIGTQGSPCSCPGVHDMYGKPFDPHYSSLFVSPVKPHYCLTSSNPVLGHSPSACDLGAKEESRTGLTWSGTFTEQDLASTQHRQRSADTGEEQGSVLVSVTATSVLISFLHPSSVGLV